MKCSDMKFFQAGNSLAKEVVHPSQIFAVNVGFRKPVAFCRIFFPYEQSKSRQENCYYKDSH